MSFLLVSALPPIGPSSDSSRAIVGSDTPTARNGANHEAIENADFIIERRATADYSENIYFCSAPVTTSEHFKILTQIEDEMLK